MRFTKELVLVRNGNLILDNIQMDLRKLRPYHFDHQKGEKYFRFYENYPSLKFREKARGEGFSSMLGSLYISSLAK